ncbi:MAG: hypothetical protein MH252_09280 [Thermosynechococcaceae cyanobacterium MS004]|nr:hypothetical protein [Thermosynechococcaceae cyanobacterium MS004]
MDLAAFIAVHCCNPLLYPIGHGRSQRPDAPLAAEGVQGLKTVLNNPSPVVNIADGMALDEMSAPTADILIETLQPTDNSALDVSVSPYSRNLGRLNVQEMYILKCTT